MITIINDVTIFTTTEAGILPPGSAVAVKGSRIADAGPLRDLLKKYPENKLISGGGQLLIPGFINTHMHFYSTFARGMALKKSPSNFTEILSQLWWRLDRALDDEAVYLSALTPAISAIKSGVTSVIDHHAGPNAIDGSLDRIEDAIKLVGLRAALCYEVSDRDGPEKANAGIEENIRYLKKIRAAHKNDPDHLLSALFGLHASFTLNDDTLQKAAELGNGMNSGFHIHLAESAVDNQRSKHNQSATQRLAKYKILGNKTIAAHAVHIDQTDRKILAATDTIVAHCPQSNMNNAVGRADIFSLMDNNILVGLGTDGMTASLFPDIRAANLIHKHDSKSTASAWNEIQKMVLQNNPLIFERISGQKTGKIASGYLADFILIDYYPPTPITNDNIWGHLLFGIADAVIDTVFINGKTVMRDKQIAGIDEKEIAAKSRECAQRVWRRF